MPKDPYKILHLDPGASLAEIKQAHEQIRELYEPSLQGNESMRSYAREKLEEADWAYLELTNRRPGLSDYEVERESGYEDSSAYRQQAEARYRQYDRDLAYEKGCVQGLLSTSCCLCLTSNCSCLRLCCLGYCLSDLLDYDRRHGGCC